MNRTAVMAIEGVLKPFTSDDVISPGLLLYHALNEQFTLALVFGSDNVERMEYWLSVQGFTDHSYLIPSRPEDPEERSIRRMRQIGRVRAAGCSVELAVEPDPVIAAKLMSEGIPTLNFLHPRYAKPEFRPDYEGVIRPWSEVAVEAKRQQELHLNDTRMAEVVS